MASHPLSQHHQLLTLHQSAIKHISIPVSDDELLSEGPFEPTNKLKAEETETTLSAEDPTFSHDDETEAKAPKAAANAPKPRGGRGKKAVAGASDADVADAGPSAPKKTTSRKPVAKPASADNTKMDKSKMDHLGLFVLVARGMPDVSLHHLSTHSQPLQLFSFSSLHSLPPPSTPLLPLSITRRTLANSHLFTKQPNWAEIAEELGSASADSTKKTYQNIKNNYVPSRMESKAKATPKKDAPKTAATPKKTTPKKSAKATAGKNSPDNDVEGSSGTPDVLKPK